MSEQSGRSTGLGESLGRLAGRPEISQHFGPQGLGLWLALAGVALAVCLGRDLLARKRQAKPAWTSAILAGAMAGCVALGLRLYGPALHLSQPLAPLLDELRLPALVLFAVAWTWSFGPARRQDLARLGGLLGALLVLDFLLTAIMARQVVMGGGYLLGGGQPASDTLAVLLCLALAATLDGPETQPAATADAPAARRPSLARWLILAGLFATFSRPGLAVAALLVVFLERGPMQERLTLFCACALGIWMSLTLPLAGGGGGEELSLSWHLTAVLEAFKQEPRAWLTGLPLGEPMALAMPDLGGLDWDPDVGGLPVSVFNIPSSLLRLLAGWGAAAPALVLAGLLAIAVHGRKRFGFGLLLATLALAALTPALHTPATAGALALACALAWRRSPETAQAQSTPGAE